MKEPDGRRGRNWASDRPANRLKLGRHPPAELPCKPSPWTSRWLLHTLQHAYDLSPTMSLLLGDYPRKLEAQTCQARKALREDDSSACSTVGPSTPHRDGAGQPIAAGSGNVILQSPHPASATGQPPGDMLRLSVRRPRGANRPDSREAFRGCWGSSGEDWPFQQPVTAPAPALATGARWGEAGRHACWTLAESRGRTAWKLNAGWSRGSRGAPRASTAEVFAGGWVLPPVLGRGSRLCAQLRAQKSSRVAPGRQAGHGGNATMVQYVSTLR